MQISTNVQQTTVVVALDSPALTLWAALRVARSVPRDTRVMESIVSVSHDLKLHVPLCMYTTCN